MTEAEWLACDDPEPMLEELRGRASDRKLRLFAVACCRRIWRLIPRRYLTSVEVAERFADGQATLRDLEQVLKGEWPTHDGTPGFQVEAAAGYSADQDAFTAADQASGWAAWAAEGQPGSEAWLPVWQEMNRTENQLRRDEQMTEQVPLLRDILGPLPFRPVTIDPAWLRWNYGTVPAVARRIYDERAFHDLPILADALEDAGCTDPDILAHCRTDGPHVRGCWVVDLLLGKG